MFPPQIKIPESLKARFVSPLSINEDESQVTAVPITLYYTALERFQDTLCSAYNNQTRVLGLIIQKQTLHKFLKLSKLLFRLFSILSQFANLQQWRNCEAKFLQGVNFQTADTGL